MKGFIHSPHIGWALYSFGAVFSFAVLITTQIAPGSIWYMLSLMFFIFWSFIVLYFAIINSNEKILHKYEAELAKGIISSGNDHFRKMNEMHETLRILRHDYKYHLDTIGELLNTHRGREAEKYLINIQKQMTEKELPGFCSNSILNALLASYAERCARLDIQYDVRISMPDTITVSNYDMCIILGNLLENAVYACELYNGKRKIELVINAQYANLAVMVKNNYSGKITRGGNRLASKKINGGIGLQSVQTAAARYGGELMTEWDDATFSASVLMKV
jgi:sensor histidine kinase regulating citrate/malate metabolism